MPGKSEAEIAERALCCCVWAKIAEQIERTDHLIGLAPPDRMDWTPAFPDAWPLGVVLGHLLDCLAGFCAVLYAVAPEQLPGLTELRKLPVNHHCLPGEAAGRVAAYRGCIEKGFGVIRDSDLRIEVPTVFVRKGEPLLALLLGNLEHLINHKHQLFTYLKLIGVDVHSPDLYHFRAE